ncbi:pimeloyl-ACP methyl ester carboxylesterase [Catenuloplanes nepalensis]|uniref:Pimeloyl-ACP methyl ester carboxylesterase n=1 Tax=Catenuloplanes nepalensis TaxID=587533 RepID=A0ABT9MR96_9ACTN|nr:alpha/beta hydrolase [Catenuloplanes nepalensis]MDP9793955.1 pimeloyl-ACP methyl ester carboxylesterase [Catenuloplanes nepalensis]
MTRERSFAVYEAPAGLRVRGTIVVVPGRGEATLSYQRFGKRLAADAYRVLVVEDLDGFDPGSDVVRPLVLVGADLGAVRVAVDGDRLAPDAVVLAGLPGGGEVTGDDELDARTHCPTHRGVLADVDPGAFATAIEAELLHRAYARASGVPHLLLIGDADPLADHEALARLAKALPVARLAVVRGAHHDVLNDLQHRSVAAEIVSFLEAVREGTPPRPLVRVESSGW